MKSKRQQHFEEQREHFTERQLMMELLYSNYLNYRSTEAVRSNTSTLIWFVVIGILLSVGIGIVTGLSM